MVVLAAGAFYLGKSYNKPSSTPPLQQTTQSTTYSLPNPSPTKSPDMVIAPDMQVGYATIKLHSGKNSFQFEMLMADNTFKPTKVVIYNSDGIVLKTYPVTGPWSSLCFHDWRYGYDQDHDQKVYHAIGILEDIPGFKSIEISLLDNKNLTTVVKRELGEPCSRGIE